MADYLIIGAGLAGLHCALRLSETYPKANIQIAEAYDYVGGRVFTYKKGPWESGAGRISTAHSLMKGYVKRYGLKTYPIDSEQLWIGTDGISYQESWDNLSKIVVQSLSSLTPSVLATHTVEEIMAGAGASAPKDLLLHFPYKSEMNTMRADLALDAFGAEMGSADFFVVADGMSKVPEGMAAELKDRGVKILLNHRLTDTDGTTAIFENGSRIKAKNLILALHVAALQKLPAFRTNPIVKSVRMRPLLRTYAVFDTTTPNPVFTEKKVVTDSPIRYIIPVNKEKGVVMISYTDGDDAEYWLRILKRGGEKGLEKAIMREIRALFAPQTIPDPIFFKSHPWHDACSYWLPGTYDPKESSETIMNPAPKVFICGESFSLRQAWVEGALEHAEQMLTKFLL